MSSFAGACEDVVEAAAAVTDALDTTAPATIRWYFLEDALVALAEAEDLLLDHRTADAVEVLLVALGLISDALDATEQRISDDPAHTAIDRATRATAAATRL